MRGPGPSVARDAAPLPSVLTWRSAFISLAQEKCLCFSCSELELCKAVVGVQESAGAGFGGCA